MRKNVRAAALLLAALLLLCACAPEPPPEEPPVPEPERLENTEPEAPAVREAPNLRPVPGPVGGPEAENVPTVGMVHFAPAEYDNITPPPAMYPSEVPWEYLQLASYIRDSLLIRQMDAAMTLCFGPWQESRYEEAPNLPEGHYYVKVAVAFSSGRTALASYYVSWDQSAARCDIFPVDTYYLFHEGASLGSIFSYGDVVDHAAAVLAMTEITELPIVPCYAPPSAEEIMPERTTYIPQSLVNAVIDAVHQYEDPIDEFVKWKTGVELEEVPDLLEFQHIREDARSYSCFQLDFDNDGVDDLFVDAFFGGSAGNVFPYFFRGLPDGRFQPTYRTDDSGACVFIEWEGKTYWIGRQRTVLGDYYQNPRTWALYLVFLVSFSDGWPQEALCLPMHPDETCIASPDGNPNKAQPCPPADRPIDPYIYTRWVNTDFPLPDW